MNDEYASSDFPTVCVLTLRKHELVSVDRRDQHRVIFVFQNTPQLQQDLANLNARRLMVDPYDFWYTERRCKQLLHTNSEGKLWR